MPKVVRTERMKRVRATQRAVYAKIARYLKVAADSPEDATCNMMLAHAKESVDHLCKNNYTRLSFCPECGRVENQLDSLIAQIREPATAALTLASIVDKLDDLKPNPYYPTSPNATTANYSPASPRVILE